MKLRTWALNGNAGAVTIETVWTLDGVVTFSVHLHTATGEPVGETDPDRCPLTLRRCEHDALASARAAEVRAAWEAAGGTDGAALTVLRRVYDAYLVHRDGLL